MLLKTAAREFQLTLGLRSPHSGFELALPLAILQLVRVREQVLQHLEAVEIEIRELEPGRVALSVDPYHHCRKLVLQVPVPFGKLEKALDRQGGGPFFNGVDYSLMDAAYAPFLQRHLFLERIRKLGHIEKFPRVKAWAEAVAERPSTHSYPPAEYEAMYRDMVKRRNKWISQFVDGSKAVAE